MCVCVCVCVCVLNYHGQKILQSLCMIYRKAGQLFQPYEASLAMYNVISTHLGDRNSDHKMQIRNSTTIYIYMTDQFL